MMVFCFALLLLFLFNGSPNAEAVSYGWPLEQNYGVSATFGESRGDHFHAGIDLSTNGDTGLPVLAIADGEIYRIKIQKRAYGKALYIRHPDGMVSVYAHLDHYSTELGLEQAYEKRVAETHNRYTGDIFIDPPIKIQQGTVVAYSGETGAGLPHLHLELRREENVPINPLSNGFQDSTDPVPPAFQAIYLYPANAASAIDGQLETQAVRFEGDAGTYKADHAPAVHGDFFVSVSVYDSALRPYRRTPQRMQLSIDGKLISKIEFDKFSYSEPYGFGLIYDPGKPGASYYELPIIMSTPIEFSTPFIQKAAVFNASTLNPGKHHLELVAADANNNTSTAVMDFIVNHPPIIHVKNIKSDTADLIVESTIEDPDWKLVPPSGFTGEFEYSLDNGQTFAAFPVNTVEMAKNSESAKFVCRAPLASLGNNRVLIKARGYDGVEYSSYEVLSISSAAAPTMAATTGVPKGELKVKTYGNALRVIYDTNDIITYPLQIQTNASTTSYPLQSWNLSSYYCDLPASAVSEKLTISLTGGPQITIPVEFAKGGQPARIANENYELTLDPDSLYKDSFIWPTSIPAYTARYLYLVGPMLQLGPRGLPMKKNATLQFNYPATTVHPERLSIYRWNRFSLKWESLPAPVNTASHSVQTRISYLDLYALLYDNVPPVVNFVFPRKNSSTRNDTPKLAAEVRDTGMDVDDEKVFFYIDGIKYVADYDPDRNLATYQVEKPLNKGTHSFRVVADDWGKNRTESKKIYFRVK
ncbi:M23 family metallopeptidase [bacterium]|nr:M23 family metallopeptidase [bacterium]